MVQMTKAHNLGPDGPSEHSAHEPLLALRMYNKHISMGLLVVRIKCQERCLIGILCAAPVMCCASDGSCAHGCAGICCKQGVPDALQDDKTSISFEQHAVVLLVFCAVKLPSFALPSMTAMFAK